MPVEDQLRIDVGHEDGRVVLRLQGELDLATVSLLEAEVGESEVKDAAMVVLDLDRLDFVDSTGLRAILSARALVTGRGQEFAVTRGSQPVQRLLSLTHVAEHLRVVNGMDAADGDSA